jgi:hypothetical protein
VTDEHAGTPPETTSPESAEQAADPFMEVRDEIAALARAQLAAFEVGDRERDAGIMWHAVATTTLAFVLGNFSAAFMQALGQRAADGATKLPKRVGDLVRTRVRRKGKPDEYHIGVDDSSAATIAITEDTPDEARLALLDLDVTDDAVRGKVLRWDDSLTSRPGRRPTPW